MLLWEKRFLELAQAVKQGPGRPGKRASRGSRARPRSCSSAHDRKAPGCPPERRDRTSPRSPISLSLGRRGVLAATAVRGAGPCGARLRHDQRGRGLRTKPRSLKRRAGGGQDRRAPGISRDWGGASQEPLGGALTIPRGSASTLTPPIPATPPALPLRASANLLSLNALFHILQ